MKNKKIKIVLGLIILISIAATVGWLQYNKPHVDVYIEKADYVLPVHKLISDYMTDEISADKKYANKIIEIKGKVNSVSSSNGKGTVTFNILDSETGITCNFQSKEKSKIAKLNINQTITVKGICTGMLLDVMMKECVIID